MANTFIKIYLHLVFAVKHRDSAIPPLHERDIHRLLGNILTDNGHQPIEIGGTDNHVHILFSYENLDQKIPELVRLVKGGSSKVINDRRYIKCRFSWQSGYACMSYSPSHLPALRSYIAHQHEHHHGMTLEDEVKKMLARFDIAFDERYIIKED